MAGLAKDFSEMLIPALRVHFEVRERPPAKWKGWDPAKNAQDVAATLCPKTEDAAPWFVLGASFGNRVACAIVSEELTPVPSLTLRNCFTVVLGRPERLGYRYPQVLSSRGILCMVQMGKMHGSN